MRFANAIMAQIVRSVITRLFIGYFKARLETNSRGHYALGNSYKRESIRNMVWDASVASL